MISVESPCIPEEGVRACVRLFEMTAMTQNNTADTSGLQNCPHDEETGSTDDVLKAFPVWEGNGDGLSDAVGNN